MSTFIIETGSPLPLGVTVGTDGINFSVEAAGERKISLLLYDKKGKHNVMLDFPENQRMGNVRFMNVKGIDIEKYNYNFTYAASSENDCLIIPDARSKKIAGREKWGDHTVKRQISNAFVSHDFDWHNDTKPNIPLNDTIIYRMHVRGFTMHKSSGVKHKGTFKGIIEKIPYLKELGINYVELMPAYEFDEMEFDNFNSCYTKDASATAPINYWGYKKGNYFAPKEAYADKNAVIELKELVRALHKENIELGMEFYFVPGTNTQFIIDCLRYWVVNYHIDGFHINTEVAPAAIISRDSLLAGTKLFGADWQGMYSKAIDGNNQEKHIAKWNGSFMYDIRRFLKGDDGKVSCFVEHFLDNPIDMGVVNYIATHDSFTVRDMVSYERKHNEANGENNSDGESDNCTWNCGVEGDTRKKKILELRLCQMKNAWLMLFCSQGIPMLMAGDEFGRTSQGNNNPYCQDNEMSWLNWHMLTKNSDSIKIFEFVKQLIMFRKEHEILHMSNKLTGRDWLACGYPDVSLHGSDAWRPELENYSRQIGIMLCEAYAKGKEGFIYLAVNMHWEEKELALPKLPNGYVWKKNLDTAAGDDDKGSVKPRSISVYVSDFKEKI